MMPLRARVFALFALAFLVPAAPAAVIKVNTQLDVVAPDDQCSIREAIVASETARALSTRKSGKVKIETDKSNLDRALLTILEDELNNTYPRAELLVVVQAMIDEVAAYDVAVFDATLEADLIAFQAVVEALPANAGRLVVEQAIDLQQRVIDASGQEVERLEGLAEVDGCEDGTAFDKVQLDENTEYYLYETLEVSINLGFFGGDGTVIKPCDTVEHCAGRSVPAPFRLMRALPGSVLEIERLTLSGGDAGTGGGGALELQAQASIADVVFRDNTARIGGAIHVLATGSLDLERVEFLGNSATEDGGAIAFAGVNLVAADSVFGRIGAGEGNTAGLATGRGGAIYMMPPGADGSLALERVALIGNSAARGAALYVGGVDTFASLVNATIARNTAVVEGAIVVDTTGAGGLAINNVTMVENNFPPAASATGTSGLKVSNITAVRVANSVIAANTGSVTATGDADCDFSGLAIPLANFRRNYFQDVVSAGGCLGNQYPTLSPEQDNYDLNAIGQPLIGYLLAPLDPVSGSYYVPVYPADVANSAENRLVSRGAGVQDEYRCADTDQRKRDRLSSVDSDCDIGAVEFQVGRRSDDSVDALVDQQVCIDVVSDDIGDAFYVNGSLRIVPGGVSRTGAVAIVVSRTPGSSPNVDPVLDLDTVCSNQADIPHAEAILFTPPPGFRGETNVTYGLQWTTDGTPGANCVTPAPGAVCGDVTATAHVQTDITTGITSESLGGGAGSFLLAILGALALRSGRAGRRLLSFVFLPMLLVSVNAIALENIIYVNSGLDEPEQTSPGDGRCTLREALNTARNDQANLTGGDCLDGNEGPDIIEFAREFVEAPGGPTVVNLNDSLVAWGSVTIRCPTPASEGDPQQVCTIRRNPLAAQSFRLIDSRGSLSIVRMTLEGGRAPASGTKTTGGAIFSIGGLSIYDSVFTDNRAVSGGAIFLGGLRSSLSISGSTFSNNQSSGTGSNGGGAIATSQSDDHKIQIQTSTFSGNRSVAGAAALNLNSVNSAWIANSTFSGNVSTEGPGAIDVSGVAGGATLRNLTVVDNRSGLDGSLETWENPLTPVPVQRPAIQTGPIAAVLTSNIIGANFDEASYLLDANCGPGPISSTFNLYGDDGSTCTALTASDLRVAATTVYDRTTPANGYLSALQYVGVPTWMHTLNDPVAVQGIIIDAGYTLTPADPKPADDQVSAFGLTTKCANMDQRGASRASGNRCDRGAYEYLAVTAVADAGNNYGRNDRLVVLDVLPNDLYDNLDAAVTNDLKIDCTVLDDSQLASLGIVSFRDVFGDPCIDVQVGVLAGSVSFLRKNDLDDLRVIRGIAPDVADITVSMIPSSYIIGKFPDDYDPAYYPGRVYTDSEINELARTWVVEESMLTPGYVLLWDNNGVIATEEIGGQVNLQYRVYAQDGVVSGWTTVKIDVGNVPPSAGNDTVFVVKGSPVTLNFLANDSDAEAPYTVSFVKISGSSCTQVLDPLDPGSVLYWQCQFGKVTVDETAGTLSWTPDNVFNPFRESFAYEITDNDPVQPKQATGVVVITVDSEDANSGAILGDDDLSDMLGIDFLGGTGPLFFLPLALTLLRRRRRA